MKTSDFSFDLPEEQIAFHPPKQRGTCRLMLFDRMTGEISHRKMSDLVDAIPAGALMVFNDTKVRRARIFGESSTGGKVELLLLEDLDHGTKWKVLVSKAKKQKKGKSLLLPEGIVSKIVDLQDGGIRIIETEEPLSEEYLKRSGHIPLPPYIRREDIPDDDERYQTVYAQKLGSVAAPTAGLHFTKEILSRMGEKGIDSTYVTLHVGIGTFSPVRSEELEDHEMHREKYFISQDTAAVINRAIMERKPVIAVGTTSLRTLESAWKEGKVLSGENSTDIFIYPGYQFNVVTGLFTNFHTPQSTLLMLVSAFGGTEAVKRAYEAAVNDGYRFFSYGDAMLMI